MKERQILVLQELLASPEVFTKCIHIVEPKYFVSELAPAVKFIKNYYDQYHNKPEVDLINDKFSLKIKKIKQDTSRKKYAVDDILSFSQQQGFVFGVQEALDMVEQGEIGKARVIMAESMDIDVQRDMGIDFFKNPESRMKEQDKNIVYYSTGLKSIDRKLGGGLQRKTFTLFSANSGGGKSVMLNNVSINLAVGEGLNVLLITVELPKELVDLRSSFIVSDFNNENWRENLDKIAEKINSIGNSTSGSLVIHEMPGNTNASMIRSYLKQYETEYNRVPDAIVVDYLDKMHPNSGTRNKGIFDQDKEKSEEVDAILKEYDMIGVSASQQNRAAIRENVPEQDIIAGGLSKVNTVDNYISLFMNKEMRITGEMKATFLKTRSSDGVGTSEDLYFNNKSLRITDTFNKNNLPEGVKVKNFNLGEYSDVFQDEDDDSNSDDITADDVFNMSNNVDKDYINGDEDEDDYESLAFLNRSNIQEGSNTLNDDEFDELFDGLEIDKYKKKEKKEVRKKEPSSSIDNLLKLASTTKNN